MSRPGRGRPFGGRGGAGASAGFGQKSTSSANQLATLLKQARQSGQLNLSNREWDAVPDAVWRINVAVPAEAQEVSLDRDEGSWWEQNDLTKLVLASNKLSELSEEVRQLGALTILDVHDNQLASLPNAIGDLERLGRLTLSDNRLTKLPAAICRLAELQFLSLESNQLTELPTELNLLQSLTVLKLHNNKLQRLLDGLCQLRQLQSLTVNGNALVELPRGTGLMTSLKELVAHTNKLTSVPNLQGCSSLRRLELHRNRLQEMPVVNSGLKELLLAENAIRSLDASWLAPSIMSLDLSGNKLTELSERITEFATLERLNLSNNDITSIPFVVGTMSLKSLVITGNPIRSIRPAIMQKGTVALLQFLREKIPVDSDGAEQQATSTLDAMTSHASQQLHAEHDLVASKTLDCSHKSKPISGELIVSAAQASVRTVHFNHCALTEVPDQLDLLCQSLTHLKLNNNRLTSLLTGIPRLTSLVVLDVRHNALTDVGTLSALTSLRELMLSGNRLRSLSAEVYTLKSLEVLGAGENQLDEIDVSGLASLPRLSDLDLQGNNIAHVPPTLGNIKLRSLQLGGNPFRVPRAAILQKGTDAVLAYLRDRIPT